MLHLLEGIILHIIVCKKLKNKFENPYNVGGEGLQHNKKNSEWDVGVSNLSLKILIIVNMHYNHCHHRRQNWSFKYCLPTMINTNSEVKISSPELLKEVSDGMYPSLLYIPRTRLLTTSWIWHRWQLTKRYYKLEKKFKPATRSSSCLHQNNIGLIGCGDFFWQYISWCDMAFLLGLVLCSKSSQLLFVIISTTCKKQAWTQAIIV